MREIIINSDRVDWSLEISSEFLQHQLAIAEDELRSLEQKIEEINTEPEAVNPTPEPEPLESIAVKLLRIDKSAAELQFAQDLSQWIQHCKEYNANNNTQIDTVANNEVVVCEKLGDLLSQNDPTLRLYQEVLDKDYKPLYEFLQGNLVLKLRQNLQIANYPSKEGCDKLFDETEQFPIHDGYLFTIVNTCKSLLQLQSSHQKLVKHLDANDNHFSVSFRSGLDLVTFELCRPFVERMRYHFLDESQNRPTYTRVDRLPEWLFGYVRENILDGGPWDIVATSLAVEVSPDLPVHFLNELVRLVQWVLGERDFFRHASVAGRNSKPLVLCNAIEELLRFDVDLKTCLPIVQQKRVVSVFDVFVAGDEELFLWWLERERESLLSQMFTRTEDPIKLPNCISPFAELFCALVRSITTKAKLFTFSGPYINHVAAPLCVQYAEAIQEHANDLRNALQSRRQINDKTLQMNIEAWCELITGTSFSAFTLQHHDEMKGVEETPLQELVEFGVSLQNLETALVEDFVKLFVDSILMDRAKFAGYLMRCSHLLSTDACEISLDTEISPDLTETRRLLHFFLSSTMDDQVVINNTDQNTLDTSLAYKVKRRLHSEVLASVSRHLIEIALNLHDMTPELSQHGGQIFYRDVEALFGPYMLPEEALRLMDIAKVMSSDSANLSSLYTAINEMADLSSHPQDGLVLQDEKAYSEALSMVRAKGYLWINLNDFVSILSRRNDF